MKIAIDFDGTLVEPSTFPTYDYKLKPYARKAIEKFAKNGIEMVLNTARYTWYRIPAILFVKRQKLPIKTYLINKKPQCDLYIDDANIFCKGIDWKKIEKEVLRKAKEKK